MINKCKDPNFWLSAIQHAYAVFVLVCVFFFDLTSTKLLTITEWTIVSGVGFVYAFISATISFMWYGSSHDSDKLDAGNLFNDMKNMSYISLYAFVDAVSTLSYAFNNHDNDKITHTEKMDEHEGLVFAFYTHILIKSLAYLSILKLSFEILLNNSPFIQESFSGRKTHYDELNDFEYDG